MKSEKEGVLNNPASFKRECGNSPSGSSIKRERGKVRDKSIERLLKMKDELLGEIEKHDKSVEKAEEDEVEFELFKAKVIKKKMLKDKRKLSACKSPERKVSVVRSTHCPPKNEPESESDSSSFSMDKEKLIKTETEQHAQRKLKRRERESSSSEFDVSDLARLISLSQKRKQKKKKKKKSLKKKNEFDESDLALLLSLGKEREQKKKKTLMKKKEREVRVREREKSRSQTSDDSSEDELVRKLKRRFLSRIR